MAKAYSDDLRRKILEAYTNQEGTIAEIAVRFRVSVGYVKKILRSTGVPGKWNALPIILGASRCLPHPCGNRFEPGSKLSPI